MSAERISQKCSIPEKKVLELRRRPATDSYQLTKVIVGVLSDFFFLIQNLQNIVVVKTQ